MIGIAKGLIAANNRTMLVENGGILEITETWAQSITQRIGLVRRKSTTCKQPMSPGYIREIGFTFYRNIADTVAMHNIHDSLILNLDQTPLPFFLVGKYTLEKKGDKSVPMTNSNDYQQITGTFTISAEGNFLPIQLIYQGKSERCHAKFKFPESFDVNHSENHWWNKEKAISKIILQYVTETRERLAMPAQTPWLLISDVFKGQWTPRVKKPGYGKLTGKWFQYLGI